MWRGAILAVAALAACSPSDRSQLEAASAPPVMRWDHRPEAAQWTQTTLSALETYGAALPALEPADIAEWCPGYPDAGAADRRSFWAGLLSALAKHESTWNPKAVGGGGLWIGLVQIDPRTARGYDCDARTAAELKDGAANLSCAVRIAASQVPKRGTVSRGMRDWGPFHDPRKRAEMSAWTSAQPYCSAS